MCNADNVIVYVTREGELLERLIGQQNKSLLPKAGEEAGVVP